MFKIRGMNGFSEIEVVQWRPWGRGLRNASFLIRDRVRRNVLVRVCWFNLCDEQRPATVLVRSRGQPGIFVGSCRVDVRMQDCTAKVAARAGTPC
jgi:hypothetical protein